MRIDTQMPPLDDVRVREALNLAIDWDGMGEALFGDDVLRAIADGGSGRQRATTRRIKPWSYDPQRAKQLIEEAREDGVPVDTEIKLIARNGFFPNSAESLEAMMGDVGRSSASTSTWRSSRPPTGSAISTSPSPADRGPTLFQQQHDNNTGDAGFTVPVMYTSDGQYSTIEDPELDALILEAMSVQRRRARQALPDVFAMVHDEIIADVPMYHMIGYVRVGDRIEDWRPTSRPTAKSGCRKSI